MKNFISILVTFLFCVSFLNAQNHLREYNIKGKVKSIIETSYRAVQTKNEISKGDFIPKSKINKIIGIKKYRDTSTIGQSDGEQFTGEQEEFVLDLQNFDENIYKIFKEHGMLEIEGY